MIRKRELAIAWAAGLIDGEGHIGIGSQQPRYRGRKDGQLSPIAYHVRLSVEMTDEKTVRRLAELFGNKVTTRRRRSKDGRSFYKRQWGWKVSGRTCEPVLRELLPHLVTKQAEASVALEWFDIPRYKWRAGNERRELRDRLIAVRGMA